ncbi:MAG: hypothetical protein K0U66_00800 [Gammaproteobacteria bacterium]|nr:hypothetical protein [Gammaproteobacteria bacterium]
MHGGALEARLLATSLATDGEFSFTVLNLTAKLNTPAGGLNSSISYDALVYDLSNSGAGFFLDSGFNLFEAKLSNYIYCAF